MQRALLNHLVGDAETEALFGDEAVLRALLRFEAALAEAEAEADVIPQDAASAISQAIAGFVPDRQLLERGMATDGVVVPALLAQLRAAIGEPHAQSLHFGATSQDAIDTGLMLRLAAFIALVEQRLAALERSLDELSARSAHLTMMAHTRMQRALPMPVATKIAAWGDPLLRLRRSLGALRPKLLVIQLGGPVGTRAELGDKADAVAKNLARRLDLGLASAWHSERDPIGEFGALLSLISGSLGKFGADVALLSQNEIATIALAGGGASSAMAHKSNPVTAEILVSLARFNAGLLGTLHQALVHENERSGAAWTLEWLVLPQMAIAAGASLRLAMTLVGQISFQSGKPE
ncbi:MAG: 3-carboxy-cis,cis-muconate cycloisomerase [Devosia sp.]